MRNHEKQAHQFIAAIEKAGGRASFTKAGTGTVYVTVDSFKVRFADHGECYCREDVSVDPDGCTVLQALEACARETGIDLSRSIAARRAAEAKKAREASALAARLAVIEAETARAAADYKDRQRAAILARWPDYDSLPSKKQKRIRHKINAELEGL